MTHDTQTPTESVLVEAGKVADIATGEVRSQTMDHHYAMLEESMKTRHGKKLARARRNKIFWIALLFALPVGGATFFATNEGAQEMAGDIWADIGMVSDTDKMKESYDEALEKVDDRNALIEEGASTLGVDLTAATATPQNAAFDQITQFAGGARTALDRDRELQERFGHVRSPEDLKRTN